MVGCLKQFNVYTIYDIESRAVIVATFGIYIRVRGEYAGIECLSSNGIPELPTGASKHTYPWRTTGFQ